MASGTTCHVWQMIGCALDHKLFLFFLFFTSGTSLSLCHLSKKFWGIFCKKKCRTSRCFLVLCVTSALPPVVNALYLHSWLYTLIMMHIPTQECSWLSKMLRSCYSLPSNNSAVIDFCGLLWSFWCCWAGPCIPSFAGWTRLLIWPLFKILNYSEKLQNTNSTLWINFRYSACFTSHEIISKLSTHGPETTCQSIV